MLTQRKNFDTQKFQLKISQFTVHTVVIVLYHVHVGDSEDELDDDEPHLETVMVQHDGAVNRIRVSC